MVQFLSKNFFSWISSIFVGFFKSSRFFVSSCTIQYIIPLSYTLNNKKYNNNNKLDSAIFVEIIWNKIRVNTFTAQKTYHGMLCDETEISPWLPENSHALGKN